MDVTDLDEGMLRAIRDFSRSPDDPRAWSGDQYLAYTRLCSAFGYVDAATATDGAPIEADVAASLRYPNGNDVARYIGITERRMGDPWSRSDSRLVDRVGEELSHYAETNDHRTGDDDATTHDGDSDDGDDGSDDSSLPLACYGDTSLVALEADIGQYDALSKVPSDDARYEDVHSALEHYETASDTLDRGHGD